MSSSRSAAGVTVFEGRIYVSGGHDGLQIFNSVSLGSPGLRALTPSIFENNLFLNIHLFWGEGQREREKERSRLPAEHGSLTQGSISQP